MCFAHPNRPFFVIKRPVFRAQTMAFLHVILPVLSIFFTKKVAQNINFAQNNLAHKVLRLHTIYGRICSQMILFFK